MCTSGGLAGGFVSHKVGQMMAGDNNTTPRPPSPPKPIEPLNAELVLDPVVNTVTVDNNAALKQKKLNQKKASPMSLSNTGLQIGAYTDESR